MSDNARRLKRIETDVPRVVGLAAYRGRRPGESAAAVLARFGFQRAALRIPTMTLEECERAMASVIRRAGGVNVWPWALELCTDDQLEEWRRQIQEREGQHEAR